MIRKLNNDTKFFLFFSLFAVLPYTVYSFFQSQELNNYRLKEKLRTVHQQFEREQEKNFRACNKVGFSEKQKFDCLAERRQKREEEEKKREKEEAWLDGLMQGL